MEIETKKTFLMRFLMVSAPFLVALVASSFVAPAQAIPWIPGR